MGHKVVVASPFLGPDVPGELPFEFFHLPQLSKIVPGSDMRHVLNNYIMRRALKGFMRDFRPDAIYERHALYSFVGHWLEKKYRIPRILEVNTRLAVESRLRLHFPRLADSAEKRIFKLAKRVIVISDPLKEFMLDLGKAEKNVKVIPIGVDQLHFNPEVDGSDIRAELGLDNGEIVIGYLGAFNYYHRFNMMIPLVRRLTEEGHNVKVLAVGGVPLKVEKNKRRTAQLDLREQFYFTGAVPYDTLPRYIAAMDFAVVPGHTPYATPTKIFEFGAMGKACVAPDYIPIRALMGNGAEELIFTPENNESLYQKVVTLIQDTKKRKRLAASLQHNILTHHTWERHIEEILKIYDLME
jgi:glycosyltransferase involved in cell wall biosynthesis